MEAEPSPIVTSVALPIDYIVDGWLILEAKQLWSDLRYRFGTDDRRANISFASSGLILVAVPTRENPPPAPTELEGIHVITLSEYLYAVMQVMQATESIRSTINKQLSEKDTF